MLVNDSRYLGYQVTKEIPKLCTSDNHNYIRGDPGLLQIR